MREGESLFARRFRRIPVLFDLSGTTAGMFRRHGRRCDIRYNPWIFAKYFEENLRDTVPHEVSHYLVHAVYGDRGVKPHGPEWRGLMQALGADPGVTFNLDLDDIPQRRQRTHPYRCGCRQHELSSTRHNRVQRGRGRYQCVKCAGLLVYAPV
ncbi:MAG: SprT-like domain-containing protein [Halioglobus sp.]|nr:SprT-like domain-containing protein [Halioglobus sp.]